MGHGKSNSGQLNIARPVELKSAEDDFFAQKK